MNADAFWSDVLGEPAALAAMLDAYAARDSPLRALPALACRRVVLIGMGSSRFAALPAAAALRARGVHAVAELASTGVPTPPSEDLVAIAISASGATEETVEALARHAGRSHTVAITNHPDRALAEPAEVVLPLLAGEETGGVSCRTFQTTVALLHLIAGAPRRRCGRRRTSRRRCSTGATPGSTRCSTRSTAPTPSTRSPPTSGSPRRSRPR